MTREEYSKLQELLKSFDKKEGECFDKICFMDEHKFMYEKQAIEIKRSAYYECYRELHRVLEELEPEGGRND